LCASLGGLEGESVCEYLMTDLPMFTRLQPVLFVADLEAEVGFYAALGFTIEHREPGFVGLSCGDILFGLQHREGARFGEAQPVIWQIGTDDIGAVHERCRQTGLPVLAGPQLQAWGEWLMTLTSPNGYRVVIEGERREP